MIRPRPYQIAAAAAVDDDFLTHDAVMVVMATGTGKTVLFAMIASFWPRGRVLVLAHREELVLQAQRTLESVGVPCAVEMADQRATFEANLLGGEAKAVSASVQSLSSPQRLSKYRPHEFGLIIVDECHHCTPQTKTYWSIIDYFRKGNPAVKLLGVTATPDRGDGLALGQVFKKTSFTFDMVDAIEEGWLVPMEQQFVTVFGLDYSAVKIGADGDLSESQVSAVFRQEEMLHRVVSPLIEFARDEPTLVFCSDVKHAIGTTEPRTPGVTDIINRYKRDAGLGSARAIHGKTDPKIRRQDLEAYSRREFQFLVGCDVFTEGFDEPSVSVLGIGKKTKVRSKYAQMMGRVTRPLREIVPALNAAKDAAERRAIIAASAKPRGLVIDFVGNSGSHKLVTVADLLGGRHAPAVRERAAQIAQQKVGAVRVDDGLFAEAEEQLAREQARRDQEELARRVAEERRKSLTAKAVYSTEEVDPFDDSESGHCERSGFRREPKMATEKQTGFLAKHDPDWLRENPEPTVGDASRRIGEIRQRWDRGLCTLKQAKALERSGESGDCSKEKAGVLMELLKARQWRRRDYRLSKERWRIRNRADAFAPVVNDPVAGPVVLSQRYATEGECREFIDGVMEHEALEAVA